MGGWPPELGPAELIGSHAGVRVARVASGVVKVYDDPSRAVRERAALAAPLPGVTPAIVRSGPSWNVLTDVRAGWDPRARILGNHQVGAAAALLAGVHALRVPGSLPAVDHGRTLARRVAGAGPQVAGAFAGLTFVGDAFCHFDLHPSNWVLEDGTPVGLLDWASSGHGDPEEDLAGLLLATSGVRDNLDAALSAWETAAERPSDRARVLAYLTLLESELGREPGPGPSSLLFHGRTRTPRCVVKVGDPVKRWLPLEAPDVEAVLEAQGLAGAEITQGFAQHACNDVLRLEQGGRRLVLKVYNKPVGPWLFALEQSLSAQLSGSAAAVLSPVVLASGGSLLRVGERLAGVYEDCGDARLGTTSGELARLAVAHAALLSLGPSGPDPGIDRNGGEDLGTVDLLRKRLGDDRLDPEIWRLIEDASVGVDADLSGLPESLVHGAIHRDHLGLMSDGRVVFFDLEKARRGPRVRCVAQTAYHAAYRSNDEQLDPRKLVFYLREVHKACTLTSAEVDALVPAILRCFLRDVSAFFEDGHAGEGLEHHLQVLREVHHNRGNLAGAIQANLKP